MENYNSAYFKQLAKQLRFDLSDQEAQDIVAEFDTLLNQLSLLETIDTEGVTEMILPFEEETTFMREDTVKNVFTVEEAMANAPKSKNDYFVTVKVVI